MKITWNLAVSVASLVAFAGVLTYKTIQTANARQEEKARAEIKHKADSAESVRYGRFIDSLIKHGEPVPVKIINTPMHIITYFTVSVLGDDISKYKCDMAKCSEVPTRFNTRLFVGLFRNDMVRIDSINYYSCKRYASDGDKINIPQFEACMSNVDKRETSTDTIYDYGREFASDLTVTGCSSRQEAGEAALEKFTSEYRKADFVRILDGHMPDYTIKSRFEYIGKKEKEYIVIDTGYRASCNGEFDMGGL